MWTLESIREKDGQEPQVEGVHPSGDGSFLQKDLPGPASFQAWTASWRVFRACLMSGHTCIARDILPPGGETSGAVATVLGTDLLAEDNARAEKIPRAGSREGSCSSE